MMTLSTISKPIKYLTLSDIHLVHPRVPTAEMVEEIYLYFDHFRHTSQFTDLDYIFIAGDIFDGKLDRYGEEYRLIVLLFSSMMRFCSRFNIKLRILRGTISHDLDQLEIISSLATSLIVNTQMPLDFKLFDTLAIEKDEDTGLTILYVPDDLNPDSEVTYGEVLKLLEARGLDKVHIAIMHGYFGYQLPEVAHSPSKHDERSYLNLVQYYINIGHVHLFSVFERIIAQGSFTRKAHNEEDPKGATVCYIEPNGDMSFQFIENPHATVFKVLRIRDMDIDKSIERVRKLVNKVPLHSHISLRVPREHPFYTGLSDLRALFPGINFTRDDIDKVKRTHHLTELDIETTIDFLPISINQGNIVQLIKAEVEEKHKFTPEQHLLLDDVLTRLL